MQVFFRPLLSHVLSQQQGSSFLHAKKMQPEPALASTKIGSGSTLKVAAPQHCFLPFCEKNPMQPPVGLIIFLKYSKPSCLHYIVFFIINRYPYILVLDYNVTVSPRFFSSS